MDNPKWILYWRLSSTSTLTRQNLFALGLPPVNTPDYKTYSELVPQSHGTIDKADGTGFINSFIDISGVPLPLTWEPISDARGVVYRNVTLKINNVTVTADPSTAI